MDYLSGLSGAGLILVAVAMIWTARPAAGQDSAPFLRNWIVGQIYAMAALVCAVTGISFLVVSWPA
jgi:hypothetical protein